MRQIRYAILLIVVIHVNLLAQSEENTTIFWDTSLSMMDRDLEKDLSILEKVFQRNGEQEVQLLYFGMGIDEKIYKVENGNWNALKKDLMTTEYGGAAIYENLKGKAKNARVYVFTDGKKVLTNDVLSLTKGNYIINSNPSRNEEFLKRTALINRSRLMDFAAILPENLGSLKNTKAQKRKVSGVVYMNNKPAQNVRVAVKGVSKSTLTDEKGTFSLEANPGDSLLVSSRVNKSLKLIPVREQAEMKIFMEANTVTLDEVVVTENIQQAEVVNTGFGQESKEKVGYAVQSIDDSRISDVNTDVATATQGKFSGVSLGQNDDLSQVRMRPSNSILGNSYGLIVIDGVPLQRSSSAAVGAASPNSTGKSSNIRENGGAPGAAQRLSFLDPKNIAKITVLKGLAATNRFGSEGVNGVLLITTKTGLAGGKAGETVDLARLNDNIYSEDGLDTGGDSPFLSALKNAPNSQEAYETYASLRTLNGDNAAFYLDAFSYFKKTDPKLAERIISNLLELHANDITYLRTVAMALSTINAHENAIKVNEHILSLEANNTQAHLNLAREKRSVGRYQDALNDMHALLNGTKSTGITLSGTSKTLNREIRNLIAAKKTDLVTSGIDQKYFNNLKYDVRLVFEWNDPQSEFEIQFVNPQKRFFNWEHTNSSSAARIKDEIQNGYSSEEFEFYGDGVQGTWIINAKYLGKLTEDVQTPLVVKCTIFQNYGYPNEQSEEILVHFENTNEKKPIKTLIVR
ncbi:MAG: carboxypeptidase-like regulatory domain-containing protein [Flavobacteriaceae bacterium]